MIMLEDSEYADLLSAVQQRDRLLTHNDALRANLDAVAGLKLALATDDAVSAGEILESFTEATMTALWVAPTKGGVFTTKEREQIRRSIALPKTD
jgi:hypothetical protein